MKTKGNTAAQLRGAMTAIITPFGEDGSVDRDALDRIARWQVDRGIHGLVPCGTTGEGATLSPEEQQQVIETVVQAAGGRVPVVAGCGSNDTRRTVHAFLHDPEALFLDEPLTGLDPRGIRTMKDSISARAEEGAAVVISSHLLSLVEDMCSHILILDSGQRVFHGGMDEARAQAESLEGVETLEDLFFHLTEAPASPPDGD